MVLSWHAKDQRPKHRTMQPSHDFCRNGYKMQWMVVGVGRLRKYLRCIYNWWREVKYISSILYLCHFCSWTLCIWSISLLNFGALYYTAVFLCGVYSMRYAIKFAYLPCTLRSLNDWGVNVYYMRWTLHSRSCVYRPPLKAYSTCFDRSCASAGWCGGSAFVSFARQPNNKYRKLGLILVLRNCLV